MHYVVRIRLHLQEDLCCQHFILCFFHKLKETPDEGQSL